MQAGITEGESATQVGSTSMVITGSADASLEAKGKVPILKAGGGIGVGASATLGASGQAGYSSEVGSTVQQLFGYANTSGIGESYSAASSHKIDGTQSAGIQKSTGTGESGTQSTSSSYSDQQRVADMTSIAASFSAGASGSADKFMADVRNSNVARQMVNDAEQKYIRSCADGGAAYQRQVSQRASYYSVSADLGGGAMSAENAEMLARVQYLAEHGMGVQMSDAIRESRGMSTATYAGPTDNPATSVTVQTVHGMAPGIDNSTQPSLPSGSSTKPSPSITVGTTTYHDGTKWATTTTLSPTDMGAVRDTINREKDANSEWGNNARKAAENHANNVVETREKTGQKAMQDKFQNSSAEKAIPIKKAVTDVGKSILP